MMFYTIVDSSTYLWFPADDDNLIILDPIPGQEDCQSDYINACYVDVSVCVLSSYFNGLLFLFFIVVAFLQYIYICLMTCCIPLLMAGALVEYTMKP